MLARPTAPGTPCMACTEVKRVGQEVGSLRDTQPPPCRRSIKSARPWIFLHMATAYVRAGTHIQAVEKEGGAGTLPSPKGAG